MASESGVDLRTLSLSSSREWLLWPIPVMPAVFGLLDLPLEFIVGPRCYADSSLATLCRMRLKECVCVRNVLWGKVLNDKVAQFSTPQEERLYAGICDRMSNVLKHTHQRPEAVLMVTCTEVLPGINQI